ncbi:MAG TPA: hypothetical protein VGM28_07095 [Candidatus Limnocylindrales bacterium]|jgi:hypothetical protein
MDAVLLPPAAPAISRERHASPVVLGFLIGGAVPALVAIVAWWLGIAWVAWVAGVGIVIGALFGALLAPRMVSVDWLPATVMGALAAPLVPGALIALILTFGSLFSGVSGADRGVLDLVESLVFGALFGVVALVVAEVAGAPITLPVAFVVTLLVRRAARMPAARAAVHVGVLMAVVLAAALLTLAAMRGLLVPFGIRIVDPGY